jgi:FlaA1/EpsC-like NDP-sugar epimerase
MHLPSLNVTAFTLHPILAWPRSVKRLVVVAIDVVMSLVAMWLAFTLRLDTLHWPDGVQWLVYGLAPVLAVPIFVRFGLYRAIFRYTGLSALIVTAQAIAVYSLLLLACLWWMQWMQWEVIPRSVGILQPLIFLLLIGGSRAMARFWLAGLLESSGRTERVRGRLLIYGAGSAGVQTAAALGSGKQQYRVLGFIDDDFAKIGSSINDIRVFAPAQVPDLVARQNISDILLALPSASPARRNEIIQQLHTLPVHVRTLPGLADLASGRVTVQDIRELDIEDLLGRQPVAPDPALLARNLTGKVVMVTGAGGSIGSELCRQIVAQRPRQILLVDHNEFGLYTINGELQALCSARGLDVALTPLLGSVRSYTRMALICSQYRPATVYHAAAYKHVPLVEDNPAEGVLNNVFGTLSLARAAVENDVAHFVLVSTDKAVRPTNVMGATKRVAELILQAMAATPVLHFANALGGGNATTRRNATTFAMVRFGNVLGSSGSVVPLFRAQIAAGGPLTVTHPEVTRYFMSISEAAQLVLQAGAMAQGGDVFVLDMGQPVKIFDLASRMVALSGLTVRNDVNPDGDITIKTTNLRPGEKLYEELLIGESPSPTDHPRIMTAQEQFVPWPELSHALEELYHASAESDLQTVTELLAQLVPGAHLTMQSERTAAAHGN